MEIWKSVTIQAVLDCLSNSKRTEDQNAKQAAKDWVISRNQRFKNACHLAELEVTWVHEKIAEALKKTQKPEEELVIYKTQNRPKASHSRN